MKSAHKSYFKVNINLEVRFGMCNDLDITCKYQTIYLRFAWGNGISMLTDIHSNGMYLSLSLHEVSGESNILRI